MGKHTLIGIGGIVVLLALVGGVALAISKSQPSGSNADSTRASLTKPQPSTKSTTQTKQGDVMELQKSDEVVGTGAEAVAGKTVSVNYTGTLTDGTKFDSSYDRNQPFSFTLGGGQVIKGWDQGVEGMKVGGKRKLVIPPSLGYGDRAVSTIPANSTLVFEIELLDVK